MTLSNEKLTPVRIEPEHDRAGLGYSAELSDEALIGDDGASSTELLPSVHILHAWCICT